MAKPRLPGVSHPVDVERSAAGGRAGRRSGSGERRDGAGSPPAPSNPMRAGMDQLRTEARP